MRNPWESTQKRPTPGGNEIWGILGGGGKVGNIFGEKEKVLGPFFFFIGGGPGKGPPPLFVGGK